MEANVILFIFTMVFYILGIAGFVIFIEHVIRKHKKHSNAFSGKIDLGLNSSNIFDENIKKNIEKMQSTLDDYKEQLDKLLEINKKNDEIILKQNSIIKILSRENNFAPPEGMELRKVVCLVGSVRFKETFEKVAKEESLKGNIVLTPIFFDEHEKEKIPNREFLDELHYEKIRMSDEVLVINCNNYIGESTAKEIEFAEQIMKSVRFLESTKVVTNSSFYCNSFCCSFKEHNYTKDDISKIITMQMQDNGLILGPIDVCFIGKYFFNNKLFVCIKEDGLAQAEINLLNQLYEVEGLSSKMEYHIFIKKEVIEENINKAIISDNFKNEYVYRV